MLRVRVLLLALALGACGAPTPEAPVPVTAKGVVDAPAAAAAKKRAPVVLALVIDQLSSWVADERLAKLPADGFFARMTREGTWVHSLRYPYAITDTAPGHASLHTGRVPADSHIVVNEVPDPKTGARTSFFLDPKTKLITPTGTKDRQASSAAALAVPTVADRLRAARPKARIVSVSLKDRAALIPAGKSPDAAIYFDPTEGSFVTSSAVASSYPSWARADGDQAAIGKARETPWELLDPKWVAENARVPDNAPGEGDLDGLGVVFPHVAKTNRAFRATPMADARILALALAGARAERNPDEPLLLLVSLSPNDVLGHTFGPSSWEAWDELRRLDAGLAAFLTALEADVGPARVLLSGDHGNSDMPEARLPLPKECKLHTIAADPLERPFCVQGHRLEPDELRSELRAEAQKQLGAPDYVMGLADGYVFLSPAARTLDAKKRETLDRLIRQILTVKHGDDVANVFSDPELRAACPKALAAARGVPDRARPGEDLLTLVCRSWTPDAGAGDYFVVPKLGSFFDGEVVAGKGASHGTPYLFDRTVPLFARGLPGELEAGGSITDPVDFSAYAALAAAFAGLDSAAPKDILDKLRARP